MAALFSLLTPEAIPPTKLTANAISPTGFGTPVTCASTVPAVPTAFNVVAKLGVGLTVDPAAAALAYPAPIAEPALFCEASVLSPGNADSACVVAAFCSAAMVVKFCGVFGFSALNVFLIAPNAPAAAPFTESANDVVPGNAEPATLPAGLNNLSDIPDA